MKKPKTLGPIRYWWGPKKKCLSAWLERCGDAPFGWEWGSDGDKEPPPLSLRLFGLQILYFEKISKGFEIHVLGLWWVK